MMEKKTPAIFCRVRPHCQIASTHEQRLAQVHPFDHNYFDF